MIYDKVVSTIPLESNTVKSETHFLMTVNYKGHFMSNNYNKEISERLRFARIKAGYKFARDFASKAKIPYVTYSQHESGKRALKPEVIINYSRLLNISAQWLLTGADVINLDNERPGTKSPINKELFTEIYRQLTKMSEHMKSSYTAIERIDISIDIYNNSSSKGTPITSIFQLIMDHLLIDIGKKSTTETKEEGK